MCCKCACGWKRGKGEGSGDGPPPTRVNTASAKVPAVRMISSRIRRLRLLSSSILMYCSVSSMNSPAHSKPRTRRCPPTLFHTFNYVSTTCISVPGFAARSVSRRTLEHLRHNRPYDSVHGIQSHPGCHCGALLGKARQSRAGSGQHRWPPACRKCRRSARSSSPAGSPRLPAPLRPPPRSPSPLQWQPRRLGNRPMGTSWVWSSGRFPQPHSAQPVQQGLDAGCAPLHHHRLRLKS